MKKFKVIHSNRKVIRDYNIQKTNEEKRNLVRDNINDAKIVMQGLIGGEPTTNDDIDISNQLFRDTNSIDFNWFENEDLPISDEIRKGCRSTSVGDIISINDNMYIVDSYGFLELNN